MLRLGLRSGLKAFFAQHDSLKVSQVEYISLANNLAEQKVGSIMANEAPGSLKNLPTIMTCTQPQKNFLNLFDVWLWSYYIVFFRVFSIEMVDFGE